MNAVKNIKQKRLQKKFEKAVLKYRKEHIKEFENRLDDLDDYIDRLKYFINHWVDLDPNFKPHCNKSQLEDQLQAAEMSRAAILSMLEQEHINEPKYLGGVELYDCGLEESDYITYRDLLPPDNDFDIDNSRYEYGGTPKPL